MQMLNRRMRIVKIFHVDVAWKNENCKNIPASCYTDKMMIIKKINGAL